MGDGIAAVALYHIVVKRFPGGGMQWQQTRFAELSMLDRQVAAGEVHVRIVEPDQFPDAHAGDRQ